MTEAHERNGPTPECSRGADTGVTSVKPDTGSRVHARRCGVWYPLSEGERPGRFQQKGEKPQSVVRLLVPTTPGPRDVTSLSFPPLERPHCQVSLPLDRGSGTLHPPRCLRSSYVLRRSVVPEGTDTRPPTRGKSNVGKVRLPVRFSSRSVVLHRLTGVLSGYRGRRTRVRDTLGKMGHVPTNRSGHPLSHTVKGPSQYISVTLKVSKDLVCGTLFSR